MEYLEDLSREDLIAIVLDQQRQMEQLRGEIEQLRRKSGAAPFSKGKRKADPRPAGRKPGQGHFRFREAPEVSGETEAIPAPVTETGCPHCGGQLAWVRQEAASTIDIPAQPQPEVRHYSVEVRACRRCGRSVRGKHAELMPGQHGATAHRVGPRARALAHILHYLHGVPVRRIPAILEASTGLRLTQGAITGDALKRAEDVVGAVYEALRALVRKQSVVHTDDTGWRVGGKTAFLMAFVNTSLSVYQVRSQHRNEEVRELIPAHFPGRMICDRGKSYDAGEREAVTQQKCLSHLIGNASKLRNKKQGRARHFSGLLRDLLRQALQLSAARPRMEAEAYVLQVRKLEGALSYHLRKRRLSDPDNQTLLDGVAAQHARGNVLRFLHEQIEPTNNRAERDLRPAVIARKVSHCSKNQRGAHAFEAFTSVLQTLRKRCPGLLIPTLAKLIAAQPSAP